ncbi:MAG: YbgA family protein [Spongiibacteraceae bacterium]|jgi:uncharacterized protein YbgA (DUF1722 family)|nr:YbgA family protein [Spongiibacteraceae bacterium]
MNIDKSRKIAVIESSNTKINGDARRVIQGLRASNLLAEHAALPPQQFAPRYFQALMDGLAQPATRGSHTNVLQHLAGYLKRDLGREEKQELSQLIMGYHDGTVPLSAPVALLNRHFRRFPNPYISQQIYLQLHASV